MNLEYDKYGEWTVLIMDYLLEGRETKCLCRCSCGVVRAVNNRNLVSGKSKSCGHVGDNKARTHGKTHTRLHGIWLNMRKRCYCANNTNYYLYGERGISICGEWDDFAEFEKWAVSNGYQDGLTIDRVNCNDNYFPQNCRWATRAEQTRNSRRNIRISNNGETKILREWSTIIGTPYGTMRHRYYHGWKDSEVLYGKQ